MSADESEDDIGDEVIDQPRVAAENAIAVSAAGSLPHHQESIAERLTEDANLEKLTHFRNWEEPRLYAKMQYLLKLTKAVGESDWNMNGFEFPDFEADLIRPDYQLRTSVKQQTRKLLESITKIFERGGEGGRRGLLRGR